eukprot:gene2006-2383_t
MQAPDLLATEYDSFVMNCRVIFRNFKSSVNAVERVPAEFVDVYERGASPRHNSNSVVDKITPVEAVNDSAHRSEWMTDSVLLALYQRLNLILGEIIPDGQSPVPEGARPSVPSGHLRIHSIFVPILRSICTVIAHSVPAPGTPARVHYEQMVAAMLSPHSGFPFLSVDGAVGRSNQLDVCIRESLRELNLDICHLLTALITSSPPCALSGDGGRGLRSMLTTAENHVALVLSDLMEEGAEGHQSAERLFAVVNEVAHCSTLFPSENLSVTLVEQLSGLIARRSSTQLGAGKPPPAVRLAVISLCRISRGFGLAVGEKGQGCGGLDAVRLASIVEALVKVLDWSHASVRWSRDSEVSESIARTLLYLGQIGALDFLSHGLDADTDIGSALMSSLGEALRTFFIATVDDQAVTCTSFSQIPTALRLLWLSAWHYVPFQDVKRASAAVLDAASLVVAGEIVRAFALLRAPSAMSPDVWENTALSVPWGNSAPTFCCMEDAITVVHMRRAQMSVVDYVHVLADALLLFLAEHFRVKPEIHTSVQSDRMDTVEAITSAYSRGECVEIDSPSHVDISAWIPELGFGKGGPGSWMPRIIGERLRAACASSGIIGRSKLLAIVLARLDSSDRRRCVGVEAGAVLLASVCDLVHAIFEDYFDSKSRVESEVPVLTSSERNALAFSALQSLTCAMGIVADCCTTDSKDLKRNYFNRYLLRIMVQCLHLNHLSISTMTADEISSVSSSKDTCRHTLEPVRGVEERAFAGLLQKAVDTQSSSPHLRNYIQNFKDEYQ